MNTKETHITLQNRNFFSPGAKMISFMTLFPSDSYCKQAKKANESDIITSHIYGHVSSILFKQCNTVKDEDQLILATFEEDLCIQCQLSKTNYVSSFFLSFLFSGFCWLPN